MIFPLRLKLALITSALLLAGIGVVSVLLLDEWRSSMEAQARKRGALLAAHLASSAENPLLLEDDLVLAQLVENTAREEEVLVARILDAEGRVVASSRSETGVQRDRRARAAAQVTQRIGERLVVASPMRFGDVDVGESQIVIDLAAVTRPVVGRAQRKVLLLSGGLLGIGVLVAFALSGRITRPLRRLRVGVNALAAGDTSVRVPPTTRDEVGELARSFNRMADSLGQKRLIETAFRRYVSDHVLRDVIDNPEAIHLQGERRELTVLFIDIRQFTRLASWLGPERLVAFLNESFDLITSGLLDHGATVDKYIGDAILAYFGAPVETTDHARRGVAAAISIQRAVQERNERREEDGAPFERLRIGIGIQTGPCVVGNIGSELKMDYTAIGDPVNVANRLQKMAGSGEILVTGDVAQRVGDLVALEPLGLRQLEGRDDPVAVFRVKY